MIEIKFPSLHFLFGIKVLKKLARLFVSINRSGLTLLQHHADLRRVTKRDSGGVGITSSKELHLEDDDAILRSFGDFDNSSTTLFLSWFKVIAKCRTECATISTLDVIIITWGVNFYRQSKSTPRGQIVS